MMATPTPDTLTFLTSLKLLNGIQRNLIMIGSKISTSSTKFLFFGTIRKARWPPRCLIGWYIFDFSSDNAERNSAKRDKKQDLNVLYQFRVLWPISKKMAALADPSKRWRIELRCTIRGPVGPLFRLSARNNEKTKFIVISYKTIHSRILVLILDIFYYSYRLTSNLCFYKENQREIW